MLNDLEIARQVRLKNIDEIAAQLGLSPADIDHYGEYKAKIRYSALSKIQGNDHGKLILVSAITPTPNLMKYSSARQPYCLMRAASGARHFCGLASHKRRRSPSF